MVNVYIHGILPFYHFTTVIFFPPAILLIFQPKKVKVLEICGKF
jgi:hypothetical protein